MKCKGGCMQHIFYLILAIVYLVFSFLFFWCSAREWPRKTFWRDLPLGRYTTTQDFKNNKIVIKDLYGNEKAVFKRVFPDE
uniref:Uncharacterized protein n=1 Tax=viral metagenome TaxID=1070528 RepID=A0A6M3J0Q9_9ZZZZ